MKNPQFYSNSTENLIISLTHGLIIFTKFDDNWTKIVNFSSLAYFLASVIFFDQSLHSYSYCNSKIYSLHYVFQYFLKVPKLSFGISQVMCSLKNCIRVGCADIVGLISFNNTVQTFDFHDRVVCSSFLHVNAWLTILQIK